MRCGLEYEITYAVCKLGITDDLVEVRPAEHSFLRMPVGEETVSMKEDTYDNQAKLGSAIN